MSIMLTYNERYALGEGQDAPLAERLVQFGQYRVAPTGRPDVRRVYLANPPEGFPAYFQRFREPVHGLRIREENSVKDYLELADVTPEKITFRHTNQHRVREAQIPLMRIIRPYLTDESILDLDAKLEGPTREKQEKSIDLRLFLRVVSRM